MSVRYTLLLVKHKVLPVSCTALPLTAALRRGLFQPLEAFRLSVVRFSDQREYGLDSIMYSMPYW
jgi:hypothetical protein